MHVGKTHSDHQLQHNLKHGLLECPPSYQDMIGVEWSIIARQHRPEWAVMDTLLIFLPEAALLHYSYTGLELARVLSETFS